MGFLKKTGKIIAKGAKWALEHSDEIANVADAAVSVTEAGCEIYGNISDANERKNEYNLYLAFEEKYKELQIEIKDVENHIFDLKEYLLNFSQKFQIEFDEIQKENKAYREKLKRYKIIIISLLLANLAATIVFCLM